MLFIYNDSMLYAYLVIVFVKLIEFTYKENRSYLRVIHKLHLEFKFIRMYYVNFMILLTFEKFFFAFLGLFVVVLHQLDGIFFLSFFFYIFLLLSGHLLA